MQTILYFGSFNPIHRGHLCVARSVLALDQESEMWLVVSPQNPLKGPQELAPDEDRLQMVERAVEALRLENPALQGRIQACGIEFELPKPTYTVDTLKILRVRYPERRFSLLIGSDNVDSFVRWKAYDEILAQYPVLVYPREGFTMKKDTEYKGFIILDHVTLFPEAATQIREQIQHHARTAQQVSHIASTHLTPEVWSYIKTHRLYGYCEQ